MSDNYKGDFKCWVMRKQIFSVLIVRRWLTQESK
jgi:hypothetical protein